MNPIYTSQPVYPVYEEKVKEKTPLEFIQDIIDYHNDCHNDYKDGAKDVIIQK